MISYSVYKGNDKSEVYFEGFCLSTDEKPVDAVANGSSLIEMDTSKVYFFDKDSGQWVEFE